MSVIELPVRSPEEEELLHPVLAPETANSEPPDRARRARGNLTASRTGKTGRWAPSKSRGPCPVYSLTDRHQTLREASGPSPAARSKRAEASTRPPASCKKAAAV